VKPLRNKARANHAAVAKPIKLPAPTNGWYVGDNQADAPAGTAWTMDNVFPQLDYVRVRRGSTAYSTALGSGIITTLIPYNAGVNAKFFGIGGTTIYDISSPGVASATTVTTLTNSTAEYIQFTGSGGQFLLVCNGVDLTQIYNGATWGTAPLTTGLSAPVSNLWVHKSRIYGIQGTSLNAFYLAVDSIGGPATNFPLSSIFKYGGYLLAGGTWAISSTNGPYEFMVLVSSEGEVATFYGDYPGAANWELKGTFKISKPLGKRCLQKAGGDLAIMTEDGLIAMSQIEKLDQIALQNTAITKPIAPAWRQAVLSRNGLAGWQITLWPLESMAIVNLPKTDSLDKTQFVVNARSGAWARYLGWDANCFSVHNNKLYYGTSDGRVLQAESGGADDGAIPYTATIAWSYNDFGSQAVSKYLTSARLFCIESMSTAPNVFSLFDYNTTIPSGMVTGTNTSFGGALWGTAIWGVDVWGDTTQASQKYFNPTGIGSAISLVYQCNFANFLSEPDVKIAALDIIVQSGNFYG
jgi:hypothetical protein